MASKASELFAHQTSLFWKIALGFTIVSEKRKIKLKPVSAEEGGEDSIAGPSRPPTQDELEQSLDPVTGGKLQLKEKALRDLKNLEADEIIPPIEVEDILAGNLDKEKAFESDFEMGPLLSRRGRDYLLLVILGNLGLILGAILLPNNPITGVSLLSLFVLFNAGLWWVLFVVMDRY